MKDNNRSFSVGPVGIVMAGIMFGATAPLFIRYSDAPVLVLVTTVTQSVTIHSPFGTVIVTCENRIPKRLRARFSPLNSGFCAKNAQKHLEFGGCE